MQGLKLSIAPYFILGEWKIGYEQGVFVYRPEWTDCVYGWPAPDGAKINGCGTTPTRRQFSAEWGVFATRGPWSISLEHYHMATQPNEYNEPPLWNGATEIFITYEF